MAKQETAPATSLRDCLAGVETILSRAGLFGGNEITKARDLERRIKRLLSPEPVEPLVAEAAEFVRTFLPYIERNRKRVSEREAAQQKVEADRKALHEAHAAKQAAPIEAERKRVEERNNLLAKAAVAEVIG